MPKPTANMRQGVRASAVWAWLGLDAPADRDMARALAAAAALAGRRPALYGSDRVDDTFTGRFELACLHAILLVRRIGAEPDARRLAQAATNRVFSSFDEALREVGEGDLTVAKRMKGLARAYYGRFKAYAEALDAGDAAALAGALSRNIWNVDAAPFAPTLAAYASALDSALAATALDVLTEPERWPAPAL